MVPHTPGPGMDPHRGQMGVLCRVVREGLSHKCRNEFLNSHKKEQSHVLCTSVDTAEGHCPQGINAEIEHQTLCILIYKRELPIGYTHEDGNKDTGEFTVGVGGSGGQGLKNCLSGTMLSTWVTGSLEAHTPASVTQYGHVQPAYVPQI